MRGQFIDQKHNNHENTSFVVVVRNNLFHKRLSSVLMSHSDTWKVVRIKQQQQQQNSEWLVQVY